MRRQIPVLTGVSDVLSSFEATLLDCLDVHIGQHAVLCSDGDPLSALHPRARHSALCVERAHQPATGHSHNHFEHLMDPFEGQPTRTYRYAAWFIARHMEAWEAATDALWQRLLAA